MTVSPRNAPDVRWRLGVIAAVIAGLAVGCATDQNAPSPPDATSPSGASPEPRWKEWGGTAIPDTATPRPTADSGPGPVSGSSDIASPEDGQSAEGTAPEAVKPLPLPASCGSTGLTGDLADITDRLTEPEFTEVRADQRLECSWAGYAQSTGSQVILVTFEPNRSEVRYPGDVPDVARGNPNYFTTPALEEIGGIASLTEGEIFTEIDLHLPGMLMSITAHSALDEDEQLLEATAATASRVLAADARDGDSGAGGEK
ncbi:hypothetical protein GCM10009799_51440 [Nocardiopsis rhodophaea]|uniref:DUF3558 domain-containing protein n=1 Tax=Nocardiopsis rhodophaea TaxID=280238 RepID=A0ABN2TQH0_9ACTN